MNVLIIGAGAVGQVFGHHLARGGAKVSVLVKEEHLEEAEAGYPLYRYRRSGPEPARFEPVAAYSDLGGVGRRTWDQAWLCVPTTALEGPWLEGVLEAVKGAVVVSLVPGLSVRSRLLAALPEERLCEAAIGFFSGAAPLDGSDLSGSNGPGTGYCTPPLTKSLFTGAGAEEIVKTLQRGKLPARVDRAARADVAFTSAVILPLMVALEGGGWTFAGLLQGEWLSLGARAAREALAVTSAAIDRRTPWFRWFLYPALLRLGLAIVSRALPIDFERYLAVHFRKVRHQTKLLIPSYRFLGQQVEVATPALTELEKRVWKPLSGRLSSPPLHS